MWQLKATSLMCIFYLLSPGALVAQGTDEVLTIMVEDAAPPWSKSDSTGYANDVVVAAFQGDGG